MNPNRRTPNTAPHTRKEAKRKTPRPVSGPAPTEGHTPSPRSPATQPRTATAARPTASSRQDALLTTTRPTPPRWRNFSESSGSDFSRPKEFLNPAATTPRTCSRLLRIQRMESTGRSPSHASPFSSLHQTQKPPTGELIARPEKTTPTQPVSLPFSRGLGVPPKRQSIVVGASRPPVRSFEAQREQRALSPPSPHTNHPPTHPINRRGAQNPATTPRPNEPQPRGLGVPPKRQPKNDNPKTPSSPARTEPPTPQSREP
jgi:hypothetical protein